MDLTVDVSALHIAAADVRRVQWQVRLGDDAVMLVTGADLADDALATSVVLHVALEGAAPGSHDARVSLDAGATWSTQHLAVKLAKK
jgi:hypothetical protein